MAYKDETLDFDLILPQIKANNRKQVIQILAAETAGLIGINERVIFDRLMDKERQASSGIGRGIAIPHMRVSSLTKPFLAFAKVRNAVEFSAIDDEPVDMFCLLLSPERDGPHHLKRLAAISRKFNDDNICEMLRATERQEDIRHIIVEKSGRNRMAA